MSFISKIHSGLIAFLLTVTAAAGLAQSQTVYIGDIGYYPVVVVLDQQGNNLSGKYMYTKRGKYLDLKGTSNAEGTQWTLTESYQGKPTGYFAISLNDGAITGQWSAKPDMSSPLEVNLTGTEVKFSPDDAIGQKISGKYVDEHTTITYEGDDAEGNPIEKEHDVKDEMAVRYIGDGYFSFWISVVGANFHTGEVYGLGQLTDGLIGVTVMEDCQLKFDFNKAGTVSIDELDCGTYHGARAYFGVTMDRK